MAGERLPMRKIRDVLRLKAGGLSKRQIAASVGIGPTAAGDYLRRAEAAGLAWPLPEEIDDAALEARLYPPPEAIAAEQRPLPDWAAIHRELKRPGDRPVRGREDRRDGKRARDDGRRAGKSRGLVVRG